MKTQGSITIESVLEKLSNERVLEITPLANAIQFTEKCDRWFCVGLSKQECQVLIDYLQAEINKLP